MGHPSWVVDQFFYQAEFSTVSSELNFYIFLCFQFWCCFIYTPLIYIYFELQKHYHHSIILIFIIQSRSTAREVSN
jgi:hypothetical protein